MLAGVALASRRALWSQLIALERRDHRLVLGGEPAALRPAAAQAAAIAQACSAAAGVNLTVEFRAIEAVAPGPTAARTPSPGPAPAPPGGASPAPQRAGDPAPAAMAAPAAPGTPGTPAAPGASTAPAPSEDDPAAAAALREHPLVKVAAELFNARVKEVRPAAPERGASI